MLSFLLSLFFVLACPAQAIQLPPQPNTGPGGSTYLHQEVTMQDFAEKEDGYWLFTPVKPLAQNAPVVVFLHGYGAYNPMIYGQWIRHLVRKGNIVIFPRYQENLFAPRPEAFSRNVSTAIIAAKKELEDNQNINAIWDKLAFFGHSYGGVIAADLAVNFASHGIPKPAVALLCSPGTGPLSGGRLSSYEGMPADLKLLIVVSEEDQIVGDEFGIKVFKTATAVKNRNFLRQYPDRRAEVRISAGHNEAYSLDLAFDSGVRNYSAKKALRVARVDPIDYLGYWKLGDALLDCSREGKNCTYAFGDSPEQRSLGQWSDGKAVRELEVILPESTSAERAE